MRQGGDIQSLNGGVPTEGQALELIRQAKGIFVRLDEPHLYPNPHTYWHINYLTEYGIKGTIKIFK